MRKFTLCLAVAILCAGSSAVHAAASAQQNASAAAPQTGPQTARQALLEMFFSKTPGTLVKHLPAATRAALDKSGALKSLDQYSLLMSQFQAQGQTIQTYETGSVLLSGEDAKKGQKIEITVESDARRGELDDIEVSFQVYKNGMAQKGPFLPHMIFSMKQENQIWTLNEISVTIHLPLADPDFLKAMTEKMTPQVSTAGATGAFAPRSEVAAQTGGNDAMVVAAMRTILTAEVSYASSYPNVGFSCTLSNLDGFGGGEPNEHQAMLINSGLASGKRYGYVFSLSGCGGTPATGFHLTAAPNGNGYGRKAFCADQSGVIRSSSDGNPATCMANGTPVQ
jgi:type IV pilus assembly protein PilA